MATKADIDRMIPGKTAREAGGQRSKPLENPTWTKIRQRGDVWGARVEGPKPNVGDVIEMVRKDGSRSWMAVDEIVWSGRERSGVEVHLVTLIKPEAKKKAVVAPAAPTVAPASRKAPPPDFQPVQYTPDPIVPTSELLVAVTAPGPVRVWSPYQEAIFHEVLTGHGHVVVLARAGSGKTTTAEEAIRRVPSNKSVLFTSFAKKIMAEIVSRFAVRPAPNVEMAGLNSYGFAQVRKRFPKVRVDKDKEYKIATQIAPQWKGTTRSALIKVVGLMKATLEYEESQVDALLDKYDIDAGEDQIDLTVAHQRATFIKKAIELLWASKDDTTSISFDDQIWFPIVYDIPCRGFDYVFIDETQDLSPAQLELSMRAVKKGGRIFAIGDDRQSIFAFRGADEEAVPHIIERLRAKILKLTISYRCAKRIAVEARMIVPDFESGSPNEGVVEVKSYHAMMSEAMPGDFILSRSNAPLISICWKLLRAGKKATIAGRDIGKGLIGFIEKAQNKGARTVAEVQQWVEDYANREAARLLAKNPPKETEAEALFDKVACIEAMAEGAADVDEMIEKIQALFSDDSNETRIVCSTTHQAKGLERDRAWIIKNTYRKRPGTQEDNMWYVAITRAKNFLYYVNMPVNED